MAITNPTKYVSVRRLQKFEQELASKYQTQAIAEITGLESTNVEGALAELLGKINALPSAIVPKGTKTFAQLAPSTDLAAANVGFMWNISDAFVTTADFVEGAGHNIPKGANVYVANPSTGVYKYDVFQGDIDLSAYATKVSGAISGNFAGLDANGNLTDSGSKASDFKTKQTAVADSDATTDGTGITFVDAVTQNANGEISVHKKGVQLAVAPDATQSITGQDGLLSKEDKAKLNSLTNDLAAKADKDTDAVSGNIAEFDGNGNPVDSGHALSEYKTKQEAVTDPTASGTSLTFIDSFAQDANGEVTVTKKTVANVSASTSGTGGTNGLMLATDKEKLDLLLECSDEDIESIFA